MIFSGMKRWELLAVSVVLCAAPAVGSFDRVPFWIIPVFYMPFFAVLCLWRPLYTLISYPRLKKRGERAEAVVTEYRRVQWGGIGGGTAEVIRFTDGMCTKHERELFTVPMLTRKVGRSYTIYFDAKKEDEFIIVPQSFIAAAVWVLICAAAELPAVIMLLLYNGG